MNKEDIRIKKVIIHILDPKIGEPVLSGRELDFGSEFVEFIKNHIARISREDGRKECYFYREESEVYKMLEEYTDERFIHISRRLADLLFQIMSSSIDIPPADLAVARFGYQEEEYIALLKLNYKESYVHRVMKDEEGTEELANEIIKNNSILPSKTQKLTEAAVINLKDKTIWLTERKYTVNGEKVNYFSRQFLKCHNRMTTKAKLAVMERVLESVISDNTESQFQYEEIMKTRSVLNDAAGEDDGFSAGEVAEMIFADNPGLKVSFLDRMEKHELTEEKIKPKEEKTIKRYWRQELITDDGIEIKIPMKSYKDPESVQFINNPDGTVSVVVKNINFLKAKL